MLAAAARELFAVVRDNLGSVTDRSEHADLVEAYGRSYIEAGRMPGDDLGREVDLRAHAAELASSRAGAACCLSVHGLERGRVLRRLWFEPRQQPLQDAAQILLLPWIEAVEQRTGVGVAGPEPATRTANVSPGPADMINL